MATRFSSVSINLLSASISIWKFPLFFFSPKLHSGTHLSLIKSFSATNGIQLGSKCLSSSVVCRSRQRSAEPPQPLWTQEWNRRETLNFRLHQSHFTLRPGRWRLQWGWQSSSTVGAEISAWWSRVVVGEWLWLVTDWRRYNQRHSVINN